MNAQDRYIRFNFALRKNNKEDAELAYELLKADNRTETIRQWRRDALKYHKQTKEAKNGRGS